jgi:hypothetical protein
LFCLDRASKKTFLLFKNVSTCYFSISFHQRKVSAAPKTTFSHDKKWHSRLFPPNNLVTHFFLKIIFYFFKKILHDKGAKWLNCLLVNRRRPNFFMRGFAKKCLKRQIFSRFLDLRQFAQHLDFSVDTSVFVASGNVAAHLKLISVTKVRRSILVGSFHQP